MWFYWVSREYYKGVLTCLRGGNIPAGFSFTLLRKLFSFLISKKKGLFGYVSEECLLLGKIHWNIGAASFPVTSSLDKIIASDKFERNNLLRYGPTPKINLTIANTDVLCHITSFFYIFLGLVKCIRLIIDTYCTTALHVHTYYMYMYYSTLCVYNYMINT